MRGSITDPGGILTGHFTDHENITGCTVLLFPEGAVAGVHVAGYAAGARELSPLDPSHLVPSINGLLITGGSAFGLDAAGGVMEFLKEKGWGLKTPSGIVPVVPSCVIYDLSIGEPVHPGAKDARLACETASDRGLEQGSCGAGCGATAGKFFGIEFSTKGGLGTSSIEGRNGVLLSALAVVNPFGDVIDSGTGEILAGARSPGDPSTFAGTESLIERGFKRGKGFPQTNTTIGVVATNAGLTRVEAKVLARRASSALALSLSPPFTSLDGDVIFALSVGRLEAFIDYLAVLAVRALKAAVVNAIRHAEGRGGIPSWRDLEPGGLNIPSV